MSISVLEKWDSRDLTTGESASERLGWLVFGTDDEQAARLAVTGTTPPVYFGLTLQSIAIKRLAEYVWDAAAQYGIKKPKETGDSSFSFDTGGGTQHIAHTLETVNKYAPPGKDPPESGGLIGNQGDSVEGVDIVVPTYRFTETHYLPVAVVTGEYKAKLFRLTGRTNDAPFRGFEEGEVLFEGASGSQRGEEDWEVSFRWAASPNVTDLTIGPVTGIAKKGWEYLWVLYEDAEDDANKKLMKKPRAVYVERVYEDGDFSELEIGT